LVTASGARDVWSLTASHEMIEMLVDPFGNRMVAGDSPKPDQGRVQFLVEACDPSENATFAYTVNGILVSDFYSPRYFDPVAAPGVRYSFTGALQEPRQVLQGGYLSWLDVASGEWWQETWFGGSGPSFRNLGRLTAENGSFRSQIDRMTSNQTQAALAPNRNAAKVAGLSATDTVGASAAQASQLEEQIDVIMRGSAGEADRRGREPARPESERDQPEDPDWQPEALEPPNRGASASGDVRRAPAMHR
jgi:hypothetical protein